MYRFQTRTGAILHKSDKGSKIQANEEYKQLFNEGKVKIPLKDVFLVDEDIERKEIEEQKKIDKVMNKIFRKFGVQYNLSRPNSAKEAWEIFYELKNKKV